MNLFEYSASYPQVPGFKARDTSRDAAASMKPRARTLRDDVLDAIKRSAAGLTADECAVSVGATVLATRPRLTELSQLGKIVDSGARRANSSGRNAVVWKAAP